MNAELKTLRRDLGLTQKELADVMGVAANTVARWERGVTNIPRSRIESLQKILYSRRTRNAIQRIPGIALDHHHEAILIRLESHLDPAVFEQCAIELLKPNYPGLVQVFGGNDDGFDGAVADTSSEHPFPLIVTTSGKAKAVDNFTRNLDRSINKNWKFTKALFATSRRITPQIRGKLFEEANKRNIQLIQVYDQGWFASSLYHNSKWCKKLLDITGTPNALSIYPKSPPLNPDGEIIGREEEMAWLLDDDRGDCLLVGQPGSGKTFLLRSLALQGEALFMVGDNWDQIANDIRNFSPRSVIVDDAHAHRNWIEYLLQIRQQVNADFRIIASSWPGEARLIRAELKIGARNMYELELIVADVMVEIIKSMGIKGPDALIEIIRKQAAGKPGLAAMLVHACRLGDIRQVLNGQSLLDQVALVLDKVTDRDALKVLGPIALSGSSGVKSGDVDSKLGMTALCSSKILADLAYSGMIQEFTREISDGEQISYETRLLVTPEELRGPLVHRIFFQGPGVLPFDEFIRIVPEPLDALETLIAARSSGALISNLESWLEEANSLKLWQQYASLGRSEVNHVLDKHPELAEDIWKEGLLHVPERIIPMLLDNIEEKRSNGRSRNKQDARIFNSTMNKLKYWIEERPTERNWTLREREILLRCAEQHAQKIDDEYVAIHAMCIAVNPGYQYGIRHPGMGNKFTVVRGMLPAQIVDSMFDMWLRLMAVVESANDVPWTCLFELLTDLAHPPASNNDSAEGAPCTLLKRAIDDLVEASKNHPGVQRKLKHLAKRSLGLEIEINTDPVFECLYPAEREKEPNQSDADLILLARKWSKLSIGEIAKRLSDIEHEANIANVAYFSRTCRFCTLLSEKISDPVGAAKEFMRRKVSANLTETMVEKAVASGQASWSILEDCLNDDRYERVGIWVAITTPNTPSNILSAAIDKATSMPSLIRHACTLGQTTETALKELFRSVNDDVAYAAAQGHWKYHRRDCSNMPLAEDWRNAVLKSAKSGGINSRIDIGEIDEILENDSELALEWFLQLVRHDCLFYGYQVDQIVEKAGSILDQQQRMKVIQALSCNNLVPSGHTMVRSLVGKSTHLYRELLNREDLASLHLAPLVGKPSDSAWISKAVMALEAGYSHEDIVDATQTDIKHWTGSEAAMWSGWVDEFNMLREDGAPEVVRLGSVGAERMSKYMKIAQKRERLEAVHGYS